MGNKTEGGLMEVGCKYMELLGNGTVEVLRIIFFEKLIGVTRLTSDTC
jgi:hypothetical protein